MYIVQYTVEKLRVCLRYQRTYYLYATIFTPNHITDTALSAISMNKYVPTEYNLFLLFSLQYQYVLLFINTKKLGTRYFRTHFLLCLKQPTSDPYHFLKVVCEKKNRCDLTITIDYRLTIDSKLNSTS